MYAVDSFNRGFHNNTEITYISKNGYVTHPQQEAICESKKTSQDGSVLIKIVIKNISCRNQQCYLCCNIRGWIVARKKETGYDYFGQSSCRIFTSSRANYMDGFDTIFMDSLEKYIKLDLCCDECQFVICKNTEIWINNDLFSDLYKIIKNGKKIEEEDRPMGFAGY